MRARGRQPRGRSSRAQASLRPTAVPRLTAIAPSVFLAVALCLAACSAPTGAPRIELLSDAASQRIVVSGLSTEEAAALRSAQFSSSQWTALLRVTTGDGGVAAAGRYAVAGRTLEFHPAFPLDPGRPYRVEFDPARLPAPRAGVVARAVVSLPGAPVTERVSVSAVYPSADVWPSNLLRFYVHFSGPMAREAGAGRVHVLDDTGAEVADALLPSPLDFWSPDQTRYTVLFEPGRVKRGIQPNVDMGRALVEGRKYTIQIDAAWRDAAGRPLVAPFRQTFRAGPPRELALSLHDWRLTSPAVGSRAPLVVTVPLPLDQALFARAVGVMVGGEPLDGVIALTDQETQWRFTPAGPWRRATHELVVLSALEDPSGNRIGRAFEVLPTDPAAHAEPPERFTIPITLR